MKCSRCHRPLKFAAVTSGGLTLGSTCSRILGIAVRAVRQKRAVEQTGQIPLFEAAAA